MPPLRPNNIQPENMIVPRRLFLFLLHRRAFQLPPREARLLGDSIVRPEEACMGYVRDQRPTRKNASRNTQTLSFSHESYPSLSFLKVGRRWCLSPTLCSFQRNLEHSLCLRLEPNRKQRLPEAAQCSRWHRAPAGRLGGQGDHCRARRRVCGECLHSQCGCWSEEAGLPYQKLGQGVCGVRARPGENQARCCRR